MSANHIEEVARRVATVVFDVSRETAPTVSVMAELVGMLVVETARVADRLEEVTDELATLVRVR